MSEQSYKKHILEIAKQKGILRSMELLEREVPRAVLSRLVEEGELLHVTGGLYMHPEADITEHHTLVEVAARYPSTVICLLSALSFHGMTTELPHEVWLAHQQGKSRPKTSDFSLRTFTFSKNSFLHGVETHVLEGVEVRITTPAKTVADCFKFRSQMGMETVLESLKDFWRMKKGTLDELEEAARICRVSRVMRPYVEAIL